MENGHIEETNNFEASATTNGTSTNGGVVQINMDYNTDFPTLPDAAPTNNSAANAAGAKVPVWSRPSLAKKDVVVTFRLASDERSSRVKSFGNTSEEQKKAQFIAQQTKTRIELSESKDGELTVVVRGERAKVEDARARIVRDLQTQASRDVEIPKEHHGKLIGKEGQLLRQLEQSTNCRIHIPGRDDASRAIKITGPREGIQRAAAHILAVSERESKLATEHVICPKHLVPFVRGPFNKTYERLTAETGAKINIPPAAVQNELISITGEKDGVHRAAAEIRAILESKKNVSTVTIPVNRAQHRYIVGQQRSGIHEILEKTGVIVDVPNEELNSDIVTLIGDSALLGQALELVVNRASSVITQSINAPTWLHKHLIGPKGATLTALVPNRNSVQIEFDDNGTIFFEGAPAEVKLAQTALAAEVARLISSMAIEKVKVHPSLHRHVIGRGGSLISKIKDQHEVQITIPNETTNSDEITIEGKKDGVKKAVAEIRAIVTKIENEKSRDIIIPQRLHKLIIGTKGAGVQQIRDAHPNVSILFPDAKNKSDVVNIRGDKNEVDAVYKKLTVLSKELAENNFQQTVSVFKEFLKHIIGKGGATIRKIRDETETRIDLPDNDDDKITVTGKQANVEKAIAQLNKIQEELANVAEETLDIPQKVQARLLGNGRRLISDIEEECGGVHIKFPTEKSESTKVTIRGPAGDVARAVGLLTALAKDKEANFTEDTVKAKSEFHRFLIGKGGSKIAKLREQFNVRIMFPREGDADKETIHLLGPNDEVPKAKAQLEEAIRQLSETVDIKLIVDPKYYKHFLVRGAALVREIQEQNGGVVISFPKNGTDSNEVSLRGSKQCVESAKLKIEEIVEDHEKQITTNISIPAQFHRSLLAGRAQKIQELQSQFNVQIRFPNNRDNSLSGEEADKVSISGRDTKVADAIEALLALVPISKVIQLPTDMHRTLIGKGGESIRKLMTEYDVNILIPKDNASEDITVTGQVENVEQALEGLREKLVEYEAQAEDRKLKQWSMTIEVPSDYHQKIIGQRGATITALKEKFGVYINVPREEGNENITIQGYEEKARACAAEIEEMIGDLRSLFTQEISLDSRYHPRLIGSKGKNLKKVMEDYRVEIRLPRHGAEDPNLVVIAGKDENDVYDCIDFLRAEEEDFLLDNVDRFMSNRSNENGHHHNQSSNGNGNGVQIRGAPWQQLDIGSAEQFPDMGPQATAASHILKCLIQLVVLFSLANFQISSKSSSFFSS
ncbi:unnamed protein product [Caenorhabditis angaria]|uniref:K Homology domain-containing protein n=1 Tax=Caenorhabditis angaria TaxID=860376 RepID=A0A9P1I9F1_9PELO|nr:unnamed protein product [Caenorhabditis angaria]